MKKIILPLLLFLVIGGGFWVIKHQNRDVIKQTVGQIYYCPMHPNYTSDKPGDCPICGMTLVLKKEERGQEEGKEQRATGEIFISSEKQQTIGVKKDTVRVINLQKSIRAKGVVEYDERKIYHIHTKLDGFIEKLYVNYTGRFVNRGEALFTIYSPELVSSQEEYLLALKSQSTLLIEASKKRLKLWDINDKEIEELQKTGIVKKTLTIYSPYSGFVIEKMAVEGMKVMPGDELYRIADLSSVWINADIYEQNIAYVKLGQTAEITLGAMGNGYRATGKGYRAKGIGYRATGKGYRAKVTYIYPYLDTEIRTVKVRIELLNPEFLLKQGMYVDVEIKVNLGRRLSIVDSAVIDTGERQIAILAKEGGHFMPVDIKLGAKVENYYEVLRGLNVGDKVVTNANFLIDSESIMKQALSGMEDER